MEKKIKSRIFNVELNIKNLIQKRRSKHRLYIAVQKNNIIDLDLPGGESNYRTSILENDESRDYSGLKRWILRSSGILASTLIFISGVFIFQTFISNGSAQSKNASTFKKINKISDVDGRVNFLLLGRGGDNKNSTADLTESITVASVDTVNKTAVLISVPKDMIIDIPNHQPMKLDQVWETGEYEYDNNNKYGTKDQDAINAGFNSVDIAVENITGVKINYNIIANFAALKDIVNKLGGVTVNVPNKIYDYSLAKYNNGSGVVAYSGWQTLNGNQALNYIRSKSVNGDAGRMGRERQLISSIKQKIETLGIINNPIKLASIITDFANNVNFDIPFSQAKNIYNDIKDVKYQSINSVSINNSPNNFLKNYYTGGKQYLAPTAGEFNYSNIQNYIVGLLKNPYVAKENAPVTVINGSKDKNFAQNETYDLQNRGFNILGMSNSSTDNYSQTEIVDISSDKYPQTKQILINRYPKAKVLTSLPDNTIQTNGAAFVIIIGNDETINR